MSGRKSGKKPTEQQGSRTYRGSYPCLRKTPEIVVDQFDEDDEEVIKTILNFDHGFN